MEYGDHGSIIVMAPMFKPTRELIFTYDEGKTWNSTVFSDSMVDVDNIVVEPNSISLKFVVHGHYANTEAKKGLIISVDFSQMSIRNCQGATDPQREDSDYELWTPYDGRQGNNNCFLGKTVDYVRRKQSSICVNGEDHEQQLY